MSGPEGADGKPHTHEACEICSTIPDRVSNTYKGDGMSGELLPPAVGRLAIVGAPLYSYDTSRSNWALHKCPVCGTSYSWDFEYEYLAGGSEDSTVLTRLDGETGARLERECLANTEAARERMREKAAGLASALATPPDGTVVSDARMFQFIYERKWDVALDLREALPSLVSRLFRAEPGASADFQRDLAGLLKAWVGEDVARARETLRLIASSGVEKPPEEAMQLATWFEAVLASGPAGA